MALLSPQQSGASPSCKELALVDQVECTYPDCHRRFATVKDMRRHKKYATEHDYCRRCDVDCTDWDDLLKHKVEAMTLYLYDAAHRASEEGRLGPKHIVCEFCGLDFTTFRGRDLHRLQMHKASQDVQCPGCQEDFHRASELIHHLEAGECPTISQGDFERAVLTKHILKQIMKNPAEFQEHMRLNRGVMERSVPTARLPDAATVEHRHNLDLMDEESSEAGGVALCGPDQQDLLSDMYPIRPSTESQPGNLQQNFDCWSESMRELSLNPPEDKTTGVVSCGLPETTSAHYLEGFPALGPVSEPSDLTISAGVNGRKDGGAWANPCTSLALFTDAGADDTSLSLMPKYNNATDKFDQTSNLLHDRFWDVNSRDFNADMFFNTVIEKYCCPFPGCQRAYDEECQGSSTFLASADLRTHLQKFHITMRWQCPGTTCLKVFKSATALVAHTELSNKCHARKAQGYQAALEEITGGFLTAHQVVAQPVVDRNQAVVLSGMLNYGVADVKYTAKAPDLFRR